MGALVPTISAPLAALDAPGAMPLAKPGGAAPGAFAALVAHGKRQGAHAAMEAPLEAQLPAPPMATRPRGAAHATGASPGAPGGRPASQALASHASAAPPPAHERARREHDDPLDPSTRQAAQLAPPLAAFAPVAPVTPDAASQVAARSSLEHLLPGLVSRVAWTPGDARRRAMRLEIGEGALSGGALLVQAEDGRVTVRFEAPAHVDVDAWKERIAERLEKKGIDVEAIEVARR